MVVAKINVSKMSVTGHHRAEELPRALSVAEAVADPELPFLTIKDLGILRSVTVQHGVVVAQVTPTYSGCPAVSVIEQAVLSALTDAGFQASVQRVLSPPWSTEFITDEGREKLRANGISPPEKGNATEVNDAPGFFSQRNIACPCCDSTHTELVSEFGSTPCKAQYRCSTCQEPFDHFKCH